MDIFSELLKKLNGRNEVSIIFNKNNIYEDDNFLIQVYYRNKEEKIILKRSNSGIIYVLFENDEPILLENCPKSFWKSILKNL